jgi:adenosylcobinamide kinase/adenosylcobinamide-phosphate guanylyltransferase
MFAAQQQQQEITEDQVEELAEQLGQAARMHKGTVIMVTNEVGLGIVPNNPQTRRYRDLVGRCNQVIARAADQVFLVSCGLPLQIKQT